MAVISVLGGGAWGTALAQEATVAGHEARLWMRDAGQAAALAAAGENTRYLPGIPLSDKIAPTADLAGLEPGEALLAVVPAQALRGTLEKLAALGWPPRPVVLCCKGIERESGLLMTEVAREVLPGWPLAVLSGPTFAKEVARGLPTAVTLAAEDDALAERLAALIGTRTLRPYVSGDPVGAEVAGAVKNVIAIACGMVEGLGLGENARAALITRGLAETGRLAAAKGGRPESLLGLAGIGDMSLTCNSPTSRNFALGRAVAADEKRGGALAEGAFTAGAVVSLAANLGVEMPIAEAVAAVLDEGASPADQARALLRRPFRKES